MVAKLQKTFKSTHLPYLFFRSASQNQENLCFYLPKSVFLPYISPIHIDMTPFLQLVARDLRQQFGTDLSRVAVVFPNKRAELFLNDYLMETQGDQPLWAPQYLTINTLFHRLSNLALCDTIDAVCRIYQLYRDETHDEVSLDQFYGWAERILADFDDVDKNMAQAEGLFQNLSELQALSHIDFLSEEQIEVLQDFFHNFNPDQQSQLIERFQRLWDALLPIYQRLNADLLAEGLAYEGALFRRVVEQLEDGAISLFPNIDHYAIVGFNVLDQAEHRLFKHLQREGKALFYWDYDEFYAGTAPESQHFEAGTFLRENLLAFGNRLDREHFDNLRHIQKVEMVAASTESVQVQSAAQWLATNITPEARRTAVVICNEALLQPLLHSLPTNIDEINVTKGFPLGHTEAAAMVETMLASFERKATAHTALNILQQLLEKIEETHLQLLQRPEEEQNNFDWILQTEAFYLTTTLLNRLHALAAAGRLEVNAATLRRVVRQIVRQATIPFSGEPAVGLQVMGVLETRCLDFDHLIMLSVNEGTLPQNNNDNSFIPYLLRKAFGLTTPERRNAVYAYYFYRLIQRTKHLRLLYNTSTEGLSKGEMSRFMTQLMAESQLPIQHVALTSPQNNQVRTPKEVVKPIDLLKRLTTPPGREQQLPLTLSPSGINTYMRCELSFYYKYVMHYKEPKRDEADIQPNTLGSIFHNAAEIIYTELIARHPQPLAPDLLKNLAASTERLKEYVQRGYEKVLEEEHLAPDDRRVPLLEGSVVVMYLQSLLLYDAQSTNLRIEAMEQSHTLTLSLPDTTAKEVKLLGKFDRIDKVDLEGQPHLRILDYKTGGNELSAKTLEDIFTLRGKEQIKYLLQTFTYALIWHRAHPSETSPIVPALLYINHARKSDFTPYLEVEKSPILDFKSIAYEVEKYLKDIITEILDPERPFRPILEDNVCKNCPYRALCYY